MEIFAQKNGFPILGTRMFSGATNRIRTYDPLITNEMLCQLSYSGEYSVIICGDGCFVNTFWRNNLNFCEGLSARVARGQKKEMAETISSSDGVILLGRRQRPALGSRRRFLPWGR